MGVVIRCQANSDVPACPGSPGRLSPCCSSSAPRPSSEPTSRGMRTSRGQTSASSSRTLASLPWVMENVGPYYAMVKHWAMEALERGATAKMAAIEKLEEARPGSKQQIENFGIEFAKFTEVAILKVQSLLHSAQDTSVQIMNGKFDWAEAKVGP